MNERPGFCWGVYYGPGRKANKCQSNYAKNFISFLSDASKIALSALDTSSLLFSTQLLLLKGATSGTRIYADWVMWRGWCLLQCLYVPMSGSYATLDLLEGFTGWGYLEIKLMYGTLNLERTI